MHSLKRICKTNDSTRKADRVIKNVNQVTKRNNQKGKIVISVFIPPEEYRKLFPVLLNLNLITILLIFIVVFFMNRSIKQIS